MSFNLCYAQHAARFFNTLLFDILLYDIWLLIRAGCLVLVAVAVGVFVFMYKKYHRTVDPAVTTQNNPQSLYRYVFSTWLYYLCLL